jgi:two-component system sensor histidine kinase AtoS
VGYTPLRTPAESYGIRTQLQAEIAKHEGLETQLQHMQAIRALDLWAGSLAHEIKNPLTSIRAFVQLVSHKRHDGRFVEKFERVVLQELDRIDLLVNELLQFAKPLQLRRTSVHVPTVLQRVLEVYSARLHLQNVLLKAEIAASIPALKADGEQLHRALANIVLNAIEAMPAGGTLSITCRPLQESACYIGIELVICDTGVGIATEQLTTLFTPFQTTKPKGTGLGLALTRKIIEAHSGRIQLTSTVGHGTTVTITLPDLDRFAHQCTRSSLSEYYSSAAERPVPDTGNGKPP